MYLCFIGQSHLGTYMYHGLSYVCVQLVQPGEVLNIALQLRGPPFWLAFCFNALPQACCTWVISCTSTYWFTELCRWRSLDLSRWPQTIFYISIFFYLFKTYLLNFTVWKINCGTTTTTTITNLWPNFTLTQPTFHMLPRVDFQNSLDFKPLLNFYLKSPQERIVFQLCFILCRHSRATVVTGSPSSACP